MPTSARSYAAQSASTPLGPYSIERRRPTPTDVAIEISIGGFVTLICTRRATNGRP